MRIKRKNKSIKALSLSKIFLYSALFFAFFSFFGVYRYTVYSWTWFVLFFVYELLFYFGLKSGRVTLRSPYGIKGNEASKSYKFELTKTGSRIITLSCIISIFCFLYFIFLYRGSVGAFAFSTYGAYTAVSFEEGRTVIEKITLLLMHMGSEAAFLICAADQTEKYKRLKVLTYITLFLPGLRYLLMGSRFCIATEFLLLLFIKWPALRARINYSGRARREKRLIVIVAILLGIAFLYLFASRAIYYTALERRAFNAGDMQMKQFWRNLYEATNGRIDFICTASDYLGEAPYIFSYFCKNRMPDQIYWGQFTFRSILQIVNNLLHVGNSYSSISAEVASGQYAGMAWILIADFGTVGSFILAFLIGHIFALVERYRNRNRTCHVMLPIFKVMCFFAPIFYFYVGRLDFVLLFCLILAPLCLRKGYKEDAETSK